MCHSGILQKLKNRAASSIIFSDLNIRASTLLADLGLDSSYAFSTPMPFLMLPFILTLGGDDIFMICTEGLDHLKIFIDSVNNIHLIIKFTTNQSLTNASFLDILVSLHNGAVETEPYSKPLDEHQPCNITLFENADKK